MVLHFYKHIQITINHQFFHRLDKHRGFDFIHMNIDLKECKFGDEILHGFRFPCSKELEMEIQLSFPMARGYGSSFDLVRILFYYPNGEDFESNIDFAIQKTFVYFFESSFVWRVI